MILTSIQPFIDSGSICGAVVLVTDRQRVIHLQNAGWADVKSRTPMTADAMFWIASMTKPITATLCMMLVESGDFRLDDPIDAYLPELKKVWVEVEKDDDHLLPRRSGRPITIRQLLSHTAGMRFCSDMETPTFDTLPLETAVRSYALTPLSSDPGTRYAYSNMGINTVGRLIERVSGQSFENFLDERLIHPLGMTDTTFWPTPAQLKRLATSYKPSADGTGYEPTSISQLRTPLSDRTRAPLPAGGLFSTATDVARFCRMILIGGELEGRRYLSESSIDQMMTPQSDLNAKEYGLGWGQEEQTWGHSGAFGTNFQIDRRRGLALVYMVQHAGYVGNVRDAYKTLKASFQSSVELA